MSGSIDLTAAELEQLATELEAVARELGADDVAALPAADVVIDERVRLKCRVPLCSGYGRNLMCPPNTLTPEEMSEVLRRYRLALFVQQRIQLTSADVAERFGGLSYAEAVVLPDYESVAAESQKAFAELMGKLETAAFKRGLRFAAAFTGGDCKLCPECVGQGSGLPCRHPFAARPAMEAVGIDVIATAARAGLVVEMPAVDLPSWTGLLLLD
jgi:predicted metal-binding protein